MISSQLIIQPIKYYLQYLFFHTCYRVHPILKQQQHHDINANGISAPLFSSTFSPFSSFQHSSTVPLPSHIPAPSPQQPTHPFAYHPLSMAAAAVAHHKTLQEQQAASNVSFDSHSANRNIENSSHKSGTMCYMLMLI